MNLVNKKGRLVAAAMLALFSMSGASARELLHPMFQDHAVLQRDRSVRIWGDADPGAEVAVAIAGAEVKTRASTEDGRWEATLPAQPAGGPHKLQVRSSSGETRTVTDVLFGDVWLCSGQSNMEMPLRRVTNSDTEIAGSTNERIRLLSVGRDSSSVARRDFITPVKWETARPGTVDEFSAVCYFLGRDLQAASGVPQGLIHSSWGGSVVQAWISTGTLSDLGGYENARGMLSLHARSPEQAERQWQAILQEWWSQHDPRRNGPDWRVLEFDDSSWLTTAANRIWEDDDHAEFSKFDGIAWYRYIVTLTREQAEAATLALGPIDDFDATWVNGVPVGFNDTWTRPREYQLARGVLKPGKNVIAVAVLDSGGGGGLWGDPKQRMLRLASGETVLLDGAWRYRPASSLAQTGVPPRAPWGDSQGMSTLYNAMIAPLAGYTLRGVAWYQGEANVGESAEYARLLPALFHDWRKAFGADLPFLVVQLADFGPVATRPVDSLWASLRDVQRRVVQADPHAALAVTIDVGDRYDIHPTNKQQVGRRLVLAARRLVHGEDIVASGPTPIDASRAAGQVVVRFSNAASGLVVYGDEQPIGFELCDDGNRCEYADATVQNDRVLLEVGSIGKPSRVRYAWADSPMCNLYNESDLPAVPFEIRIQE
ncbi:MAG TPA: sialate O-acetylesterase [Steroidobacter sp.]|uniref:sialate O-acetylesterase n=1 Tax=Steroidobacter sp. TaxID=1978227 RepID=UPI002EDB7ECB